MEKNHQKFLVKSINNTTLINNMILVEGWYLKKILKQDTFHDLIYFSVFLKYEFTFSKSYFEKKNSQIQYNCIILTFQPSRAITDVGLSNIKSQQIKF